MVSGGGGAWSVRPQGRSGLFYVGRTTGAGPDEEKKKKESGRRRRDSRRYCARRGPILARSADCAALQLEHQARPRHLRRPGRAAMRTAERRHSTRSNHFHARRTPPPNGQLVGFTGSRISTRALRFGVCGQMKTLRFVPGKCHTYTYPLTTTRSARRDLVAAACTPTSSMECRRPSSCQTSRPEIQFPPFHAMGAADVFGRGLFRAPLAALCTTAPGMTTERVGQKGRLLYRKGLFHWRRKCHTAGSGLFLERQAATGGRPALAYLSGRGGD